MRAGLEAAIRSIDDHRYGMPGREAEWSRLIMRRLADLDPAAIAAGVPECLSAMEQVALDLHDALGVKWGDDPYAAISALRARVAELEKDAARLAALECVVDGIGGIDIHEEADINASAFGRDEPNKDDYLAAIRTAIDAAMRED